MMFASECLVVAMLFALAVTLLGLFVGIISILGQIYLDWTDPTR